MLGADLSPGAVSERRKLEETEALFQRRLMRQRLHGLDDAIRRERDQLPFNRTSGATLRKLIAALRAGNMEVRRYEKEFLHAKASSVLTVGLSPSCSRSHKRSAYATTSTT